MSDHFADDDLRAAYTTRRHPPAAHTAVCPSPDALLAAVRGQDTQAERLRVLDHALQCDACRPQLALLHAVQHAEQRALPAAKRRLLWQRLTPLAAAAAIVLAIGIVTIRPGRNAVIMRGGSAAGPALAAPADAATVASGPVTFVWHPLPRAIHYTIEVTAEDGAVAFTGRTADTTVTAQLSSTLAGEHRWWVRAQLDDGSEQRSETRVLRRR